MLLAPLLAKSCRSPEATARALAFIGAHDFASRGRRIHAVVTFGAPCVALSKDGGMTKVGVQSFPG